MLTSDPKPRKISDQRTRPGQHEYDHCTAQLLPLESLQTAHHQQNTAWPLGGCRKPRGTQMAHTVYVMDKVVSFNPPKDLWKWKR